MNNSFIGWYVKMWLRTHDDNYYRHVYHREPPPKDLSQYFVE